MDEAEVATRAGTRAETETKSGTTSATKGAMRGSGLFKELKTVTSVAAFEWPALRSDVDASRLSADGLCVIVEHHECHQWQTLTVPIVCASTRTLLTPGSKRCVRCHQSESAVEPGRPCPDAFPERSVDFPLLVRRIEPTALVYIFEALLCESKIVVTSSNWSDLTPCLQALQALTYPMRWPQIYIPVLPKVMPIPIEDLLQAPVPLLIGMHSSMVEGIEFGPDVVKLNLDTGRVKLAKAQRGQASLPVRYSAKLSEKVLRLRTLIQELDVRREAEEEAAAEEDAAAAAASLIQAGIGCIGGIGGIDCGIVCGQDGTPSEGVSVGTLLSGSHGGVHGHGMGKVGSKVGGKVEGLKCKVLGGLKLGGGGSRDSRTRGRSEIGSKNHQHHQTDQREKQREQKKKKKKKHDSWLGWKTNSYAEVFMPPNSWSDPSHQCV
jgi:hypothetical protein